MPSGGAGKVQPFGRHIDRITQLRCTWTQKNSRTARAGTHGHSDWSLDSCSLLDSPIRITHTPKIKAQIFWILLRDVQNLNWFNAEKYLKRSWLPEFWEKKKIQNTQEIKRTLFNWTKQNKTCKFSRNSSFSSYEQHKNRKTNNLFNLSCVG